jgi:hypothetical protein
VLLRLLPDQTHADDHIQLSFHLKRGLVQKDYRVEDFLKDVRVAQVDSTYFGSWVSYCS